MTKQFKLRYVLPIILCMVVIMGVLSYFFLSPFSSAKQTQYVYIDSDDTVDSVYAKLSPTAKRHALNGFKTMTRHTGYAENIRTGRYAIEPSTSVLGIFRHLKNGHQTPLNLTIPSVRTLERLAGELSHKLMLDSAEIIHALRDSSTCSQYDYDTTTIACMFIPNTYEVYWNISLHKFLNRMKDESNAFWNEDRISKAHATGLTPEEVITLASIIDEETANDKEKPMIAGMYLNRLHLSNAEYPNGMPLQADPTVKFAWKNFELRRIYNKLLSIDSPYNTYRYTGLPPGPIRIASVAGIESVLNFVRHDYLYMCAKEDFSGTHNFAKTYSEHQQNAAKYVRALNARGIK